MDKNTIVSIKGRQYDARSGAPIDRSTTTKKTVPASEIHQTVQRSHTLRRASLKKPAVVPPAKTASRAPQVHRSMDIARSSHIKRFAPHPIPASTTSTTIPKPDIGPVTHPHVSKAHALQVAKHPHANASIVAKTPKQIKEEAITLAMAQPTPITPKKSFLTRHKRFINIFSIIIVILVIGTYVTYINLPNLSVRIAAAQAGINATFPGFQPDGYSVNGPVSYSNGKVTINFVANTGNGAFSIIQTKSSWDSTALQNQVNQQSSGQFLTTQTQGLTIYTYGDNASWVNAGILYNIVSNGHTQLSSDQITQIATSM